MIGLYYFEREDYVKAREVLEKWHEVVEKGGYKGGTRGLWGSEYLIRTYIELGEVEKAKKLIDDMYEFAPHRGDTYLVIVANYLRGMQFRAEKKWQESIDHFEKSLRESVYRRCDPYNFAKRMLVEYARVYLERDQEGDRERAHKLLDEALEIFQKMGAIWEIEKIIAMKKLLTA